jgi:hypothetical protein
LALNSIFHNQELVLIQAYFDLEFHLPKSRTSLQAYIDFTSKSIFHVGELVYMLTALTATESFVASRKRRWEGRCLYRNGRQIGNGSGGGYIYIAGKSRKFHGNK